MPSLRIIYRGRAQKYLMVSAFQGICRCICLRGGFTLDRNGELISQHNLVPWILYGYSLVCKTLIVLRWPNVKLYSSTTYYSVPLQRKMVTGPTCLKRTVISTTCTGSFLHALPTYSIVLLHHKALTCCRPFLSMVVPLLEWI